MMNTPLDLNKEPLWFVPKSMQEGLGGDLEESAYRNFLLSGIYIGLNLFLLILFGIYAATIDDGGRATVLFSLAVISAAGYGAIWFSGLYWLGRYFTALTMAFLCLYLFYDGGLHGTGPLYYFVFPSMAILLFGAWRGLILVTALLALTLLLWLGVFGLEVAQYDNVFVARLIGINLILAVLTCIPEYRRRVVQLKLLLAYSDLEALTYGDPATGMANRTLLEKILQLEVSRSARYNTACCVMFIEPDSVTGTTPGVYHSSVLPALAEILRGSLREQDIAGRWENHCFLMILPEIGIEGAGALAQRLLTQVENHVSILDQQVPKLTVSIGLAVIDSHSPRQLLDRALNALHRAQGQGGNSYCVT